MFAGNGSARLVETNHMAVKKCRHGTMMYNVNDSFIGRSLDLYGEWCDDEVFVLDQMLAPGHVIVDVGANIGTHTVFFARKVTESGMVIAFEPQRLVYQTLCGNVALNGFTNVMCMMSAVGAERGTLTFPTIDPRSSFNFGAVRGMNGGAGEMVEVIPIDDLNLRQCTLIKVDVEGMESAVLQGARKTIERCKPALFIENDTTDRSRQIFEALESIGYKAYWQIANFYNPQNYFQNPENIFERYQPEANLVCVPTDCDLSGLLPAEGLDDDWRKARERLVAARGNAPSR